MCESHIRSDDQDWQRKQLENERHSVAEKAQRYCLPIFQEIAKQKGRPINVLNVGCGNGEDVDVFNRHGFDCIGVEPGFRKNEQKNREFAHKFYDCSGSDMPFEDGSFDVVVSFGVIEHIGAVGDSRDLFPDYRQQRQEFADELVRVTKPGGVLIITTPNRLFPIDFWHGPFVMGGRFHTPWDYFCLSAGDIDKLFKVGSMTSKSRVLSLKNFFTYKRAENFFLRPLVFLAEGWLALVNVEKFEFLRRNCCNPFLIVRYDK